MDPLEVAWVAAGRPRPACSGPGGGFSGVCARCGAEGEELVPTSRVVSDRFTDYDQWADPSGAGLCPACTWAYREARVRAEAHSVSRVPAALTFLTAAALGQLLCRPVEPDVAVAVPLRPGRKHVLPAAAFGRVCVDGTLLSWSTADCERLDAMSQLRAAGVSTRALAQTSPPWPVVRGLGLEARDLLLRRWAALDPWRRAAPWFDLGVAATKGDRP